jgi:hypothetical protein
MDRWKEQLVLYTCYKEIILNDYPKTNLMMLADYTASKARRYM